MGLQAGDVCWEIGPGLGAITHDILPRVKSLTAFEIDNGFIGILKEFFADDERFSLQEGDALKNWPNCWKAQGTPDLICGNLPYNIGATAIASFIEKECLPPRMVYTLQKEVVQRMSAGPGSKLYSAFSVVCSLDYEVELLFDIAPGAFYPVPEVTSSVVGMKRREYSLLTSGERTGFLDMVHRLFSSRRKTILNNLSGFRGLPKSEISSLLTAAGFNPSVRAERLSLEMMIDLYRVLMK